MKIDRIDEVQFERAWLDRLAAHAVLKLAAARACVQAGLINRFDHLFLDCGTTFVYLSEEIFVRGIELAPLTVYSTNVEIFQRYLKSGARDLMDFRLVGGRFIPHHYSFDGSLVSGWAKVHQARPIIDRAFIGVCPLDSKLRVMATITDVVRVKQEIVARSGEVVIVCDESKFTEAPPGSRTVGYLSEAAASGLSLTLEGMESVPIAARVVIGLSAQGLKSPGFASFIKFAEDRRMIDSGVVILGRAEGANNEVLCRDE